MGREEYEEILARQAVDDTRRRRLRKMLKTRKSNKGEGERTAPLYVDRCRMYNNGKWVRVRIVGRDVSIFVVGVATLRAGGRRAW